VLALDPDSAGEAATLRSVGLENSLGAEMRVAVLPEGQDPDEIIIQNPGEWRRLITAAVPALDFTFEKNSAGLDLKTAKGKADAVEKLMPIVMQIKDVVRQTYYLDKLAQLVGQSPKKLELLMIKNKNVSYARAAVQDVKKSSVSNPVEEYCLAILLKHSELIEQCGELKPEYFNSSENREVYNVILRCGDVAQVKPSLDSALWEHYEHLAGHEFLANRLETKLAETILRLREEHLKRLAQNRSDSPAVEEGNQLRELFVKKEHMGEQKRRQK